MFGSEVLDVVIGILFVYLTLSLVCSAVQEVIAAALGLRAKYLYRGILTLLDDPKGAGLVRDFYNHPLINTLFPGEYELGNLDNLPSYIPARAFALAIMDLAVPRAPRGDVSGAAGATIVSEHAFPPTGVSSGGPQRLRESLTHTSVLPPKVSQALLTLTDAAGSDPSTTRENIEQWYNNAMERVSSAYKRRTQAIILAVGFFVTAAVNADSIGIATTLSTNKAVRESLAAVASQVPATRDPSNVSELGTGGATGTTGPNGGVRANEMTGPASRPPTIPDTKDSGQTPMRDSQDYRLELNLNRIRNSGFPIGWVRDAAPGDFRRIPNSRWQWIQKIIGMLLTVAAISMGAPFWFDVLSRVTMIRSASKPAGSKPAPRPPM